MPGALQKKPPVAAQWTPPPPPPDPEPFRVTMLINVPDYATVRRNATTGQVEIDDLVVEDLMALRDSIGEQIVSIQQQIAQIPRWEPM
jgi:hypothetical protein